MDQLITGDCQIQNPNDFYHHITPFPANGSSFLPSNGAAAATAVGDDNNFPPQKLRPIRGIGKVASMENDILSPNTDEDSGGAMVAGGESSDVAVNGGGSGSVGGSSEDGLSLSSDDDNDDSSARIEGLMSRKRKRESRKKLEGFLEGLVMKVMERQDEMHKQLMEMIERTERERLMREEAWKQQETERMKRDDQVRVQETSRNLALINLIQNVMGCHGNQAPQPLTTISHMENINNGNRGYTSVQSNIKCEARFRRWQEAEVRALITLRSALEQQLQLTGSKGYDIWEAISVGMRNMGYHRNARTCKIKWEKMNNDFEKSIESVVKDENGKMSPFFRQLDIYKNGFVNPGNGSTQTKTEANGGST